MREWQGLPPDAMILAPALAVTTPMRSPDGVWAMLVLAVDIVGDTDPERAGEVELFAGSWVAEQPPADLYDGDLVVRLISRAVTRDKSEPRWRDVSADVEMLLARRGRWQLVGRWGGLDERWPWLLAPTAAAVMGLHCDALSTLTREVASPAETSIPMRWASGGVGDLLDAGLVKPGDELVWNRRNHGVRHTARIRIDDTLISPTIECTPTRPVPPPHWAATTRTAGARFGGYPTGAPWASCGPNCGRGAGSKPCTGPRMVRAGSAVR